MDNQKISDKALKFPNPKFVSFIKRMWDSEPVSLVEKTIYDALSVYAPVTLVDKVTLPLVEIGVKYEIVNILLPDLGNDLDIKLEAGSSSSSSSSSINIFNGGAYNISAFIAEGAHIANFNLDINIKAVLRVLLQYTSLSYTEPIQTNGSFDLIGGNTRIVLFSGLKLNGLNQVFNIVLDIETVKFILY